MATMEELYQQYLLTQPGIGGSQNRYRELMSQARPFVNPYPGSTGLLAGATRTPAVPKVPTRTNPMGTYITDGGLDSGYTNANDPVGPSGPNVSFDEDGNIVANNVNPNLVGGVASVIGLGIGVPFLGLIANALAKRYNLTNDEAAKLAMMGIKDTTDPANLTGLIGRTATTGPTGTGGQASRAAAAAAADARAMGFTDAAIAAAAQAAVNATIDGKTAAEAAAAARSSAFAVAQNIDDDFFSQDETQPPAPTDPLALSPQYQGLLAEANKNFSNIFSAPSTKVAGSGLIGIESLVDPRAFQTAQETFRQSEINAMNQAAAAEAAAAQQAAAQAQAEQDTAAVNVSSPTAVSMTSMQDALNRDAAAAVAAREADRASFVPGLLAQFAAQIEAQQAAQQAAESAAAQAAIGSYGGGSFAEQQAINDAIAQSISDQNLAGDAGGFGGYSDGGSSTSFGEGQYAKGGKVIKAHLKGPDPRGPDEGYGALLGGEFVIKKSAVKKYGEGLLSMINDGKIPVQKMKSLLG